jgi:ankyrin repeat protein
MPSGAAIDEESQGDEMSGGNWKELYNAGCEGDLALVEYHVRSGVDVNYAHPEFLSTPLVAAILAGQQAVALYLLDHGAAPDLSSEFDAATPMQAARRAGLPAVEARLRELGVAALAAPAAAPPRAWWARLLGLKAPAAGRA